MQVLVLGEGIGKQGGLETLAQEEGWTGGAEWMDRLASFREKKEDARILK